MLSQINNFIKYLLEKKSEVKELDKKDALLAKVVLDIHRKRTHSSFVLVPLFSLKQIHPIDRGSTLNKTENRIEKLLNIKESLLLKKKITKDLLDEYLPSVSAIKVVKEADNSYISYEGNGRVVALQQVFKPSDDIQIEVEEYFFTNPQKIIRRMNKVRRLNGLLRR